MNKPDKFRLEYWGHDVQKWRELYGKADLARLKGMMALEPEDGGPYRIVRIIDGKVVVTRGKQPELFAVEYLPDGLGKDLFRAVESHFEEQGRAPSAIENALQAIRNAQEDQRTLQPYRDAAKGGSDDAPQIDGNAIVSLGDDGAYVQAWVFVPHTMVDDTPDCADPAEGQA